MTAPLGLDPAGPTVVSGRPAQADLCALPLRIGFQIGPCDLQGQFDDQRIVHVADNRYEIRHHIHGRDKVEDRAGNGRKHIPGDLRVVSSGVVRGEANHQIDIPPEALNATGWLAPEALDFSSAFP